jgi:hypothetical protein
MQDFDVTYWFDTRPGTSSSRAASGGSSGACVTERFDEATREQAIAHVEANLGRGSFVIDLGGDEECPSLALVRTEAVRYVHIEAVGPRDPRPAFIVDADPVADAVEEVAASSSGAPPAPAAGTGAAAEVEFLE